MANNRFQTVNCEIFAHGDSWNWQCELWTERKLNRNISAELKHHCAWLPDAYVCDEHVALKVAVVTKSNKQIGPRLAVRWKPWHCTVIKLELDPNLLDNLKLAEVLTVSHSTQFGIAVIINTQSTYKSYSEINLTWQNSTLLYLSVYDMNIQNVSSSWLYKQTLTVLRSGSGYEGSCGVDGPWSRDRVRPSTARRCKHGRLRAWCVADPLQWWAMPGNLYRSIRFDFAEPSRCIAMRRQEVLATFSSHIVLKIWQERCRCHVRVLYWLATLFHRWKIRSLK